MLDCRRFTIWYYITNPSSFTGKTLKKCRGMKHHKGYEYTKYVFIVLPLQLRSIARETHLIFHVILDGQIACCCHLVTPRLLSPAGTVCMNFPGGLLKASNKFWLVYFVQLSFSNMTIIEMMEAAVSGFGISKANISHTNTHIHIQTTVTALDQTVSWLVAQSLSGCSRNFDGASGIGLCWNPVLFQ